MGERKYSHSDHHTFICTLRKIFGEYIEFFLNNIRANLNLKIQIELKEKCTIKWNGMVSYQLWCLEPVSVNGEIEYIKLHFTGKCITQLLDCIICDYIETIYTKTFARCVEFI